MGTSEPTLAAQQAVTTINQDNETLAGLVQGEEGAALGADVLAEKNAKPKETKAQKEAAAKSTAEKNALKAQTKEVANSPWTKLGDALAQQYSTDAAQATTLISGAGTAPAQQTASSTALGLLGESPGGADASTLKGWAAAANAADAPVQQAMAAEGATYAAEAGPITKALQAYGQANALEVQTAPEASWLQALGSHVTSNLSYYGSVPTADVGVLEQAPGVAQALQQAGGYGGQTGSGLTPLQDIKIQNGQVSVAKQPSGGAASPGTVSTATAPAPGVNPGQ